MEKILPTPKLLSPEEQLQWWQELSAEWQGIFLEMFELDKQTFNQDLKQNLQRIFDWIKISLRKKEQLDIAPLASLMNLTILSLGENELTDISPLSGLVNLTYLSLWMNKLTDIAPLAGLVNLTKLNLWNNQLTDIAPLASLVNLEHLDLRDNPIPQSQIKWLKEQLPNCRIEF